VEWKRISPSCVVRPVIGERRFLAFCFSDFGGMMVDRHPEVIQELEGLKEGAKEGKGLVGVYKCPNAHQGIYNVPGIEGQDFVDFGNGIVYQWCTICCKYVRRIRA